VFYVIVANRSGIGAWRAIAAGSGTTNDDFHAFPATCLFSTYFCPKHRLSKMNPAVSNLVLSLGAMQGESCFPGCCVQSSRTTLTSGD